MKRLILVILSAALILGALAVGCPAATTDNASPDGGQIIENISPQAALDLIQQNENNTGFIILDVRTPSEYADGHIEGAINIDFYLSTFEDELNALDMGKTYLIYCRSGHRGGQAQDMMEELGFAEVYNLAGGINAWQDAGLATVTD